MRRTSTRCSPGDPGPRAGRCLVLALLVSVAAAQQGCSGQPDPDSSSELHPQFDEDQQRRILRLSPLPQPPLDPTNRFDGDARAERLGRFFFYDRELSANGEISCATCHDPKLGFSDGKPVAEGLSRGRRRVPALWNQAYGHWYFHDGRADTLWSQALQPLESEIEMGSDRLAILWRIARAGDLRRAFEDLRGPLPELSAGQRFPAHARPTAEDDSHPHGLAWEAMASADREAVNRAFSDVGKTIAAYERRLVSRDSPFDRFVAGLREGDLEKQRALTPGARRGLGLFLGKGRCRLCHNGPNFSDGEFHGLGLAGRGGGMPTDPGRYAGVPLVLANEFNAAGPYSDSRTGERALQLKGLSVGPANWGEFKTPSLRNVGERAPYMHAGQFDDLEGVLTFYSTLEGASPLHQHQEQILVAREFSPGELVDLRAFLLSLQGAAPGPEWTSGPASIGAPGPGADVRKEHRR